MWSIEGRTVLVTGGNSGIGAAAAAALAERGAHVVITARDVDRGREAAAGMPGSVEVMPLDLASLQAVRGFAARFLASHDDLCVLVNNAGLFTGRRKVSEDGYEMMFAVNHLGHFLLTNLLLERLAASAPSRVITVASSGHHMAGDGLALDDPAAEHRSFRATKEYGRSKLANVLFTRELARRTSESGIQVFAVHPGTVRTRIAQDGDSLFAGWYWKLRGRWMLTPEQGADTIVWLATEPDPAGVSGDYLTNRKPGKLSRHAADEGLAAALWARSEELVDR